MYWLRASNILRTPAFRQSCVIFYNIPSPTGNFNMAREIARLAGRPFVFPPVTAQKQYRTYDASHMEVDTAKRWTAEFIPLLDPEIDKCMNIPARVPG